MLVCFTRLFHRLIVAVDLDLFDLLGNDDGPDGMEVGSDKFPLGKIYPEASRLGIPIQY